VRVAVLAFALLCVAGCGGGSARTVQHVTLRTGQAVRVPTAAVRCEPSAEAGFANLYCWRIGGGRFDVVFYPDSVLVWSGPDDAESYRWAGRRSVHPHGSASGTVTLLQGDTVNAPDAATRCVVRDAALRCTPSPPRAARSVTFTARAVAVERGKVRVRTYRWAPR
jgi:hypothetical protein